MLEEVSHMAQPSDQALSEGLTILAGEGRPSLRAWHHLQERIAVANRRRRMIRLVSIAVGLLLFIGVLGGMPSSAWADLRQLARQVWSSVLGQTPSTLTWVDVEKVKELSLESAPAVETAQTTTQSFAGVARAAGFEPFQLVGREPQLVDTVVQTIESMPEYESHMVVATYAVDGTNYHLYTSGLFQKANEGAPVLVPMPALPLVSIAPSAPQGIKQVAVGETEALCFEEVHMGATPRTRCTLVLEGLQVAIMGPVPGQVEQLLQSVGRETSR